MAAAPRAGPDRGAVTVEAAIALCALTVFVGLLFAGFAAITGQLRCVDAAREAARLVARGQPQLAAQAVERIAPRGAELSITPAGEGVSVEVSANPAGGLLPGVRITGTAFAVLEPGVSDGDP